MKAAFDSFCFRIATWRRGFPADAGCLFKTALCTAAAAFPFSSSADRSKARYNEADIVHFDKLAGNVFKVLRR